MGTSTSAYDEWIELKNTTSSTINLSGWQLVSNDNSPSIQLSGSIAPYGYYLLERSNDNSVPQITADQIYTGSLGNSGEQLQLLSSQNQLVDRVDKWYAGSNANKATMERVDGSLSGNLANNWQTAISGYSAGLGTPRKVNSVVNDGPVSDVNCQYPQNLEIISINIGQGDATLIVTPTKILLADAGESYWNSHNDAVKVAEVIHQKYGAQCNTIDYAVISHLHLDHIGYIKSDENTNGELLNEQGGLHQEGQNLRNPQFLAGFAYLVKNLGFQVGQTIVRDYKTNNPNPSPAQGGSKTYRNWRAYLESPQGKTDFNPTTAELGTHQINLGTVAGNRVVIDIVQVDGLTPANATHGCDPATYFSGASHLLRGQRWNDAIPPSENDLSVAFILSLGQFNLFVGGDTSGENYQSQWGYRYHDTETCLAQDAIIQQKYAHHLDVLRANHHGSSHSTNQVFVDTFQPKVTIFSVGDNNSFSHVNRAVLDRILAESIGNQQGAVLMTEAGANVYSANDVCHSQQANWCAQVVDNEYPTTTETNESGDDNVVIQVSQDGKSYIVKGNNNTPAVQFISR
ncbi:lamin tail domain-containing protein [Aliikangiella maris]|uniref:Lamin tail domain-containing protein n=2 Tax=Aliikangiella maris TaxID=3162458 RepID=A0ABV3MRW1_9GAMM